MGKFSDKFLNLLKLDGDDDYDEYDDDYGYEDDDYEEPPKKATKVKKEKEYSNPVKEYKPEPVVQAKQATPFKKSSNSKVVPMRGGRSGMEVCVIKPSTFEDSKEVTETLLSGRAVVLNMEGMHVETAQRIIDFVSGACYSMNGNLQKISNYIFIATPETVDISGDFQDLLSGSFDVSSLS